MKWLLIALAALVGSVALALFALPDPGYVLLGYGKYSVETSLLVLVAVLVLAYFGIRALVGLWHVPRQLHGWGRRRRDRRLQFWFDDATRALAEGRFERAERRLGRLVRFPQAPLQAYLAAAQAANRRGADQRRDRYLQLAVQRQPQSETSVLIQQAELQLAAGQNEQAQTTLTRLQTLLPHSLRLLQLRLQLYRQQQDWPRLRELLPELRRSGVLDPGQWQKLAIQVYREQVMSLAAAADVEGLDKGWKQLPPPVQQDPGLLAVYLEQLLRLGQQAQAAQVLRDQLNRDWNPRFVYLYGNAESKDPAAQQKQAERWLEKHPGDPVLLLSLGKISLRNQLWGKARHYLEESLAVQPTAEAYQLLARALEMLEEPEAAAACYRKGLSLSAAPSGTVSPVAIEHAGTDAAPVLNPSD